jgi:PAS domain S-box-containing protein
VSATVIALCGLLLRRDMRQVIRQTQETLQRTESRLADAVELARLGLWEYDALADAAHWNDRCLQIFGFTEARPLRAEEIFARIHPDDRARAAAAVEAAIRPDGSGLIETEYRVVRPDGTLRWVSVRGRRLASGTAPERRLGIGTVLDWTERKQIEEQLRDADRRKDQFLAILAHELRNPLAPVRYALRLIGPGVPERLAADARAMIDRQLTQMGRLLDDLLDVSRITQNKLEIRRETLDLRATIQAAVDAMRPLAEAVSLELFVSLPPQPLPVAGDATRLMQVITNLLSNSLKFTDPGGQIHIEAQAIDSELIVHVRDNGIGISPDLLPKIFELFARGETTSRATSGLGIGLSLARELVALHGGRLQASSAGPGLGSLFSVHLPRARQSPLPERAGTSKNLKLLGAAGIRILVVDDNVDAADSLAQLLSNVGYQTKVAYEGVTALEIAELLRPAVILLDVGLPNLSGHEVARRVRSEPWGLAMQLIAITGWGHEEARRKSREAGFDEHLTKPVDPERVLELIARSTLVARAQAH